MGQRQAEQIADLAGENDERNTRREARHHRIGNVFDEGAEPREARANQHCPGHQRRQHKAVIAEAGDNVEHDHDKSAGRPADLMRLPPKAEMKKPATTAVKRPRSGPTPLAIASAIESGMAVMATVSPARMSAFRRPGYSPPAER